MNQVESAPERSVERQAGSLPTAGLERKLGRRSFLEKSARFAAGLGLAVATASFPLEPRPVSAQEAPAEDLLAGNPNSPQSEVLTAEKKPIYDWQAGRRRIDKLTETSELSDDEKRRVIEKYSNLEKKLEFKGQFVFKLVDIIDQSADDPNGIKSLYRNAMMPFDPKYLNVEDVFAPYVEKREIEEDLRELDKQIQAGGLRSLDKFLESADKKYAEAPDPKEKISLNVVFEDGNSSVRDELLRYINNGFSYILNMRHKFLVTTDPNGKFIFNIWRDEKNKPYFWIKLRLNDLPGIATPPELNAYHEMTSALEPVNVVNNRLNEVLMEKMSPEEFADLMKRYLEIVNSEWTDIGSSIPEWLSNFVDMRASTRRVRFENIDKKTAIGMFTSYYKKVLLTNHIGLPTPGNMLNEDTNNKILGWFKSNFGDFQGALPNPEHQRDVSIMHAIINNDEEVLSMLDKQVIIAYTRHLANLLSWGKAQAFEDGSAFQNYLQERLKANPPFLSLVQTFGNLLAQKAA